MSAIRLAHSPVPSRLRIALVAPPWPAVPPIGYGGTERVIALLADGFINTVTTSRCSRRPDPTRWPISSRRCRRLPPSSTRARRRDVPCPHTFLASDEFDVVHDHPTLGPVFAAIHDGGPPVVHTLHGPWTPGVRRTLGLISDRVHLVAISHAQRATNPNIR